MAGHAIIISDDFFSGWEWVPEGGRKVAGNGWREGIEENNSSRAGGFVSIITSWKMASSDLPKGRGCSRTTHLRCTNAVRRNPEEIGRAPKGRGCSRTTHLRCTNAVRRNPEESHHTKLCWTSYPTSERMPPRTITASP